MNWRQKLYSNIFWRNVLASFGERSGYSKEAGGFVPYFQYRIGPYKSDMYLYFSKEPFPLRYKNEIFNKLGEYTGYDIIRFLEFHFAAYPDDQDFLRFLLYELAERLENVPKNTRLLSALNWVTEKKDQVQAQANLDIRSEIERGVQQIINDQPAISPQETEDRISAFSEKLQEYVAKIMTQAEIGVKELTESFTTGNIELNNRNHEVLLIQLLILLQQTQAPPKQAKAEQLFKRFTNADVAAILMLHFAPFKENKINTLQRKVQHQSQLVKHASSKVIKLTEALQEFFY
jgi:hypothetical protein